MNDLISRNEMLKWLEVSEFEHLSGEKCFECMMREIKNAPAVNRWIPCSERLPEDGVKCLVCMSDKNILIAKWDGKYDKQGVWCITIPSFGTKLFRIKNVPFWMPLPEPPKE